MAGIMKEIVKNKIEELLSKEYYCSPKELNEKGTIYSVHPDKGQPYIKIMAYKNCVVVCTSRQLQREVQNLLRNKNRDEIFENPFVYGQTIHYAPDKGCADAVSASFDHECSCLFEEQIVSLNGLKGFENALAFDKRITDKKYRSVLFRFRNKYRIADGGEQMRLYAVMG